MWNPNEKKTVRVAPPQNRNGETTIVNMTNDQYVVWPQKSWNTEWTIQGCIHKQDDDDMSETEGSEYTET